MAWPWHDVGRPGLAVAPCNLHDLWQSGSDVFGGTLGGMRPGSGRADSGTTMPRLHSGCANTKSFGNEGRLHKQIRGRSHLRYPFEHRKPHKKRGLQGFGCFLVALACFGPRKGG